MSVELTLEQYKAIQEGAETWLASTRTAYTCDVIAGYLIAETVSTCRTSLTPYTMHPLFNKWLKATGKKPLYKFNMSFIEVYIINILKHGIDNSVLRELRTEFMEWLLVTPYSEIHEINT